jgi:anti-anti-sigma factor
MFTIRIFNIEMDSMEPALNLPVDLTAVEASAWDTRAETDSPRLTPSPSQTKNPCTVVVNLPEQVTAKQSRTLMRDLMDQLNVDQPCVVLDLSEVKEMDTAGLDLLLECLNETVRRDGTIRVRGISLEAATILELTGMDEILGLVSEAVTHEVESGIPLDYPPENERISQQSLAA